MADTTVHFDVMIIEAGILANCLNSSDAGHALSAKIKDAADGAWAQQTKDVVLELDPFEAGMVLDGLGKASAQISGDLITRLYTLVNDMMTALGVTPLGTEDANNNAGVDAPDGDNAEQTDQPTDDATPAPEETSNNGASDESGATDDAGAL